MFKVKFNDLDLNKDHKYFSNTFVHQLSMILWKKKIVSCLTKKLFINTFLHYDLLKSWQPFFKMAAIGIKLLMVQVHHAGWYARDIQLFENDSGN